MTIPKLKAAILVFLVGFALGLSVFIASRMFVRSILSSDAIAAAEELAVKLAERQPIEPSGTLSSVIRYTYFDLVGKVIESSAPDGVPVERPLLGEHDAANLSAFVSRGAVVEEVSLIASLLGLSESATKRVAVPVTANRQTLGTLIVEVDQSRALDSLGRAFSVVAMVTVGLAVLAVITVAFLVTRGRGFGNHKKAFDPSTLPRDPLTDLPTRSGLTAYLQDAVERASSSDQQVGLMMIGLDGFRAVNDIWDHPVGDEVLRITAERLQALGSGPAAVARVAGDEFALVVEGEATHDMRRIADRIRGVLAEPFEVEERSITLSASIGAALYPVNADSDQFLFRAADNALTKAKETGRNALAFFDTEMKLRLQRAAALERDLRLALSRDEFVVFYQPQLELASGRLRGYEALVRWERPGEGILAPRDFLAVAEETALIRPIGEWVLRKACQDAASWLDSGTVAVNFSAAQLRSPDLDKMIAKVLKETGLPAERLEIEVPESLFLRDSSDVMEVLRRVKALGVRVAMDDFGAGYTGLASLAQFPFDKIKIDRNFVGQLTEDADVAAIVAAIVALGRTLSVDVTAEGVETSEQVTLLKAAGCSIVQGFLFGVPKRQTAAAREPSANTTQQPTGTAGS
jgi:diguanylate cyclase (GGDEF)-like protein